MNLALRRMTLADIPQCHALPLLDRFAYDVPSYARLPDLWRSLLTDGFVESVIMEDTGLTSPERIVAFAMMAFIDDAFAQEARATLPPYFYTQIVERWRNGRSPLLDLEGVRKANSGEGVNLISFQSGVVGGSLFLESNRPIRMKLVETYMDRCRGYRIKQILIEVAGREQLEWDTNGGFRLRRDYADFWNDGYPARHPEGYEPYLIGLSREEAFNRESSSAATIFAYTPPRFFFQPREQELLNTSFAGLSDEEAAAALGVSHSAVRKRWETIYAKVTEVAPHLIGDGTDASSRAGAQKKRLLLSYLRDHPEELRPILSPK